MPRHLTNVTRSANPPKDKAPAPSARSFPLSFDSSAPQTGHDFRTIPIVPSLQAKLTVNTPGDAYEQEADAVAAKVMDAADAGAAMQREGDDAGLARKPLDVSRAPGSHVAEQIQQAAGSGQQQEGDVSEVVSDGLSGGGQTLDNDTQSFMENRFGHDFSQVKIHTDSRASDSAQAVAARAYTVGSDIAFRSGEYNPASSNGRTLLAHELTHVVQQGAATPTQVSRDDVAGVQGGANTTVQRDGGVTAGLVLGAVAIIQSQVNASNGGLAYSSDMVTYPTGTALVPQNSTAISIPAATFASAGFTSDNLTHFNLLGDFGTDANGNPVMANVRIELQDTTTYFTSALSFNAKALPTPTGTGDDPSIQFSLSGRFDPAGPGDVSYSALMTVNRAGMIDFQNARFTNQSPMANAQISGDMNGLIVNAVPPEQTGP